jgi:hypothetical protein
MMIDWHLSLMPVQNMEEIMLMAMAIMMMKVGL